MPTTLSGNDSPIPDIFGSLREKFDHQQLFLSTESIFPILQPVVSLHSRAVNDRIDRLTNWSIHYDEKVSSYIFKMVKW